VFHAFIWTQSGGMVDIGTLDDDPYSLAYAINDRGQVVGQSLDANFNSRAFLYENGKMYDLNKLVPPGSPTLTYANDINASGQITGGACTTCTGESIAFLAVAGQQGDSSSAVNSSETDRKGVLPERIRQMIQQRHVMGRLN
jgi:probable HAF family extracellular repeat protein